MIRDVTETLVGHIADNTLDLGDWVQAVSLHEDQTIQTGRLAVFLYSIDEHDHTRNRPLEFDGETYRRPPLLVRLSYLLAYFGADSDQAHLDEQARLERVLETFSATPVLTSVDLPAAVADRIDQLTIRLWSPSADERNQIWSGLGRSMRLGLYYQVDAVPVIAVDDAGGPPIVDQQIDYGRLAS